MIQRAGWCASKPDLRGGLLLFYKQSSGHVASPRFVTKSFSNSYALPVLLSLSLKGIKILGFISTAFLQIS